MARNNQPLSTAENRYQPLELVENWQSDLGRSPTMKKRKTPKGEVAVTTDRSRLLLRWSYRGDRYTLYLGMPDSLTNRKAAEVKAKLIERDMAAETFDRTLNKYRPEESIETIGAVELFERFTAHKSKTLYTQSLTKYAGTLSYLRLYFRNKSASAISPKEAEAFIDWLSKRIAPITLRERVSLLKAAWQWASKQKWTDGNPWADLKIRVRRSSRPKPFSRREIQLILEEFSNDFYYSHYTDYVEFLLGTGCRLGEAIALTWKRISPDCSTVHFIDSFYRGQWKGLKTEDERYVRLSDRVQQILLKRRPLRPDPDALIFPAPGGKPIDDHNFRNRAWKTILKRAGVEYRKPRTTRSTLVSHALDRGMSPAEVAELTGHTQETLFRHYAGNVKNRPQLPDLLD